MPDISDGAWQFWIAVVVNASGFLTLWVKQRKTGRRVDGAAIAARNAAELARPTGNGFADRVDQKLDHLIRITAETRQIADQALTEVVEHKNAHVAASLSIPIRRVK